MVEIPNFAALSGQSEQHLVRYEGQLLHIEALEALKQLQRNAHSAGFRPAIASGWRSFDRQLGIWNQKALGQRTLLDEDGRPLDRAGLDDEGLMWAILRWSALPGGSRHHWGTEVDIYEASRMPEGYQLQLTVAETRGRGVFAEFHKWLAHYLSGGDSGFFRPYSALKGGVAPEPWHLSFATTAARYQSALDKDALRALVARSNIELRTVVLANFDEIFRRYIWVDWSAYPAGLQARQ